MFDDTLEWRNIGPFRGGRVVAVAGDPINQNNFYFGACAGGVWKSTDGGNYWENISDDFFNTASVGAIAVSESDPNVIYVGTGESCIRVDVTHGDGVYKSVDGGRTWSNIGLQDTRHISRIRIHPTNPDLVYVAALGHAFGENKERGIFRSKDGGMNWEQVLFKSEKAGASDLYIDQNNPRIIYAGLWETRRTFWSMDSGGSDSGLYISTDGGDNWLDISNNPGLPKNIMGRIGVVSSPAKPDRVWALIEAEDGGVFRSDNRGESWIKLDDSEGVRSRPWYYTHIFAHPSDSNTIWVLSAQMWKSIDGGNSFQEVSTPHGDNHDLWIDPINPNRMVQGNDGGACVSYNGGNTWSSIYNQPTGQFYSVETDSQFPYRVYGTQQDNSAISTPSQSIKGAILWEECYSVGLSESGKIAVKPDNSNIIYSAYPGGTLMRYDHTTGQVRNIMVWPEYYQNSAPKNYKYRFGWEFPIVTSKHDPNVLYTAGNMIFKSIDEGTNWEKLSEDLTRNDTDKQGLSGPITSEGPWAEIYCTVYALSESPINPDILWAGTDDGLIYISKDGGGSWSNVSPEGLEEWTMISMIESSYFNEGTAFVAATKYKLDDYSPYVYKTNDYGQTWEKIIDGIAENDFARVVRQDPVNSKVLYLGTETGVYVSCDEGLKWDSLRLNLPVVPIYDLKVNEGDLIAATHGRSFWILDDLSPIQQINENTFSTDVHLMKPRDSVRLLMQSGSRFKDSIGKQYMSMQLGSPMVYEQKEDIEGGLSTKFLNCGVNPKDGVYINFYFNGNISDEVKLEFYDKSGQLIKSFDKGSKDKKNNLNLKKGMNRIIWDMRYPESLPIDSDVYGVTSPFGAQTTGPLALPGDYVVRLSIGDRNYQHDFKILVDPRVSVNDMDLTHQFDFQIRIRDKCTEVSKRINYIRSVKKQIKEWESKLDQSQDIEDLCKLSEYIKNKLDDIEDVMLPFRSEGPQPRGIPVGLFAKLKELMGVVASADWGPTSQSYHLYEDLCERIDTEFNLFDQLMDNQVGEFLAIIDKIGLAKIKI